MKTKYYKQYRWQTSVVFVTEAGLYAILSLNYAAEPLSQLLISNTAYYLQ